MCAWGHRVSHCVSLENMHSREDKDYTRHDHIVWSDHRLWYDLICCRMTMECRTIECGMDAVVVFFKFIFECIFDISNINHHV